MSRVLGRRRVSLSSFTLFASLTVQIQVLIGSIALFWLTSGSGLRPISSIIAEARSLPSSGDSASKRSSHRSHRPALTATPFMKRPQSVRLSSLPTIMTHGMLDSAASSFVGMPPPPSPAIVHSPLAWPSPSLDSSSGLGTPPDMPVLVVCGLLFVARVGG